MTIQAVRVSKTSLKRWALYGPIDQALKTSAQAEAVRVFPIYVTAHGETVELELWINAGDDDDHHHMNPPATVILQNNELRRRGISAPRDMEELGDLLDQENLFENLPVVQGPAILTGAGCTDVPNEHLECVLMALVGQHDDDED